MSVVKNLYNKLHSYIKNKHLNFYQLLLRKKSFVKFFISGTIAGSIDLLVLYILYDLYNLAIVPSTSIAFIVSFLASFSLQKMWTFKNQDRAPKQLIIYLLNSFLSLNINGIAMHLLVSELKAPYLLAQIFVSLFIGVFNFVIYKFIIFKKNHEVNC